jgi:hypothetical protein
MRALVLGVAFTLVVSGCEAPAAWPEPSVDCALSDADQCRRAADWALDQFMERHAEDYRRPPDSLQITISCPCPADRPGRVEVVADYGGGVRTAMGMGYDGP